MRNAPAPPSRDPRHRRWLLKLVGVLLLVGVLASIDLTATARVLRQCDWLLVIGAFCLQPIALALKATRWWSLLRAQSIHINLGRAMLLYVVSAFLGVVTPGRVGEMWKAWVLRREAGAPLVRTVPATIVDRAIDFLFYLVVGAMAAIELDILPLGGVAVWGGIVLVGLVAAWCMRRRIVGRLGRWMFRTRLARRFADQPGMAGNAFVEGCLALTGPVLLVAAALTAAAAAILYAQFYLLMTALPHAEGGTASIREAIVVAVMTVSLLKFLSNTPISIAGVGTRDVALVAILHQFGRSPEYAVSLSLLLLLVNHMGVAALGAAAGLLRGRGIRGVGDDGDGDGRR